MTHARLARIVRYPVKGLAGIPERGSAELRPGSGLRWDRIFAIENGTLEPESPDSWNPRETYFHLAKHEAIARIRTSVEDAEDGTPALVLSADGKRAALPLDASTPEARASASGFLAEILPAGPLGAPKLVRTASTGLWDWPDSHLSIINLATVEALTTAAGREVDSRRFRGNLYLDGLPAWGEFALLGRRVRIGTAVIEVFQPTDRCRATTINPVGAESDLNVPALLASRFGHMFCGLYARVVESGLVSPGAPVEILPASRPWSEMRPEPDEPGWPRNAELLERIDETAAVTSFWFSDPLGRLDRSLPGQHVRVHDPSAPAPNWRCYTVSGVAPGRFRISVKRDGAVSNSLHDTLARGSRLVVTGPFGDVVLTEDPDRDLLLVSAGIGITPGVAMLRARAAAPGGGRVRVLHSDRRAADLSLWGEVERTIADLPDAEAVLHLSRADAREAEEGGARSGRPTTSTYSQLVTTLDLARLDVYVCGPGTFAAEVRGILTELGVPDESIHSEVFFSPSAADLTDPRPPSSTGPHRISVGSETIDWSPGTGTVLDAVEGAGIDWPSGCRVGVCGTCARGLAGGSVEYLSDPLVPPKAGSVLVCCIAPLSDLVFDAGSEAE